MAPAPLPRFWDTGRHTGFLSALLGLPMLTFRVWLGVVVHPASPSSLFACCRSHDEHSDEEHRDSPTAAMTENHDGLLHARSAGEENGKTLLDNLHGTPTANGTDDASTGVRMEGQDEASDNDDIDEQVIGASCHTQMLSHADVTMP